MYEEALEIHKYLPIRKNSLEDEYITHLWQVFFTLDSSNESVQPFMIMPFHLLFMLALQYKVLRISKELNSDYSLVFTMKNCRNVETLSQPTSVFDFSLLQERTLPDLFRLISLDESLIINIKKLVDYRNDKLAHANGGIAQEFNLKIEEYLECLREVQKKFLTLNNLVANEFKLEMSSDDAPGEFIEIKLLDSYLCQADFNEGMLKETFGAVGSYI
jgi:hypothetical protein